MEQDMFKVYTMGKGGALMEYQGGPNFPGGTRKCPKCTATMKRSPVGVAYIEKDKGYLLVDTTPKEGLMVVVNTDPKYIWACGGCANAIQPYSKPKVLA